MIPAVRPARKHLALVAALLVMLVGQPLVGHTSVAAGAFFDAVLAGICLYIFFIVFEERRQRQVALAFILPAFAGNFATYLLPRGAQLPSEAVYHCFMVAFLGFAVSVILRDILHKIVIGADDVVVGLCGYMLLAILWANLYTLTYLLAPGTFSVNLDIRWRLGEWHQRRALFDYLSFTTLMTLGYGDLTPTGPPAYSIT
jgi:hypothetical protein